MMTEGKRGEGDRPTPVASPRGFSASKVNTATVISSNFHFLIN